MASSKNKRRKTQTNYQMKKKQKNHISQKGNPFHSKFNYNIVILSLIIVLLLYNTFIINKNIKKINENVINLKQETGKLENITPHYVFLGDSITEQYDLSRYYEGYSVVNSGISGDTTEEILNNMEKRVYQYNPSTVFLMIGTNDVNENKSTEYIFNNIKQIVEEIQTNLPKAKIIVESITPTQEKWGQNDKNEKRREINQLLHDEYKNSNVTYIDLYTILEDKNSHQLADVYTKDGLHLTDEAYEKISTKLKKYMITKNR